MAENTSGRGDHHYYHPNVGRRRVSRAPWPPKKAGGSRSGTIAVPWLREHDSRQLQAELLRCFFIRVHPCASVDQILRQGLWDHLKSATLENLRRECCIEGLPGVNS